MAVLEEILIFVALLASVLMIVGFIGLVFLGARKNVSERKLPGIDKGDMVGTAIKGWWHDPGRRSAQILLYLAAGGFLVFVGSMFAAVKISSVLSEEQQANERLVAKTRETMETSLDQLSAFQRKQKRFPKADEVQVPQDAWQRPLEYRFEGDTIELRSAGPDGQLETEDDLFRRRTAR